MPPFHVHLSWVGKDHAGGARGFHQYLSREGLGEGAQFHRYLDREDDHGKDDLIAHGHDHLPAWAQDSPERFWSAADGLERAKGPVFFHLQVTLLRELSPDARRALADDIRAVCVERYPHAWAIHEPMARDQSGVHPHVHIQFSTRREEVERHLSAAQWFKQPNHGGVAKDASWFAKGRVSRYSPMRRWPEKAWRWRCRVSRSKPVDSPGTRRVSPAATTRRTSPGP